MSEWTTYIMGDVIEHFIDYRGKTPKKTTNGIPLITAKIVKNGFIEEPDEFIAEDNYDTWMRRGLPEVGDVVLTTEAPLGEVAQIKTTAKIALGQRLITLRGKPDLLDNTFLRFILQGSTLQSRLKARGTGSTVQGIKSSELKKVLIDLPPLDEQKKIARVLGNLDDKIELNRRMNKTLEAMAMTLYRHYFIDFGLAPGVKYEVDECPFGKLVDTEEMGPVPEGWKIVSFDNVVETFIDNRGKTAPTSEFGIPLIATNCIKNESIFPTFKNVRYVSDETYNEWFRGHSIPNDILFVNKGTPGCVALVPDKIKFCFAQDMIAIRPKTQLVSSYFIYSLLKSDIFQEQIKNYSVGTTIPHLKKTDLIKMRVLLPLKTFVDKYDSFVNKYFRLLEINYHETQNMTETRDYLLPKLLSGEVTVQ